MSTENEGTVETTEAVEETKSTLAKIAGEQAEADTSEVTDGEAESTETDSDKDSLDKPKKKSGSQRLKHRLQLEQQEKEYWKEQALKAGKPKEEAPKEQKAEGKPKAEQFDTHEDYVEALTEWKLDQREKEREAKAKESQTKTEHQKQVERFQKGVSEFKAKHADFDEVMDDVDDIPMSLAMQSVFLESENGPELAYELAKNREEYERISKLGPLAAAKEIGKLEAKLAKEAQVQSEEKEIKTTKAPKPIEPVGKAAGTVRRSIFDKDLSFSDYERLRREQMRKRA